MKTFLVQIRRAVPSLRVVRGLLSFLLSVPALAAVAPPDVGRVPATAAGNRVELKGREKSFAEKVARMGMEEIEISRVAADRSSNPEVKAMALALVSDHTAVNTELAEIAARRGVALPAKDRVDDKWTKRNARSFDHDCLKKMAEDHEETLKLFQKQATEGEDAELVAFARKHLPHLQQHLERAKDLQRLLK